MLNNENNVMSYMTMDISEKRYESDMEYEMINQNGFRKISPRDYDKERMIFPSAFVEFIKISQPKEWARYEKYYGQQAEEKIIRRFNDSVLSNGLLYVLKNGFKDMGIEIHPCFFKPESEINTELNRRYESNIFGITRQFAYSKENNNTIDTILTLNGIPVFAFELKDQFKGQDYKNAIYQWENDRDPKEPVFRFAQRFFAYFAVDLYDVWMTTELRGAKTYFLPFIKAVIVLERQAEKGTLPTLVAILLHIYGRGSSLKIR